MGRRLFCEISPFTYWISTQKNIFIRNVKDISSKRKFVRKKSDEKLPFTVFEHSSVIRRVLGGVDMQLQENKAKNLSIAAPKINGILIHPGEVFSFWNLVGKCKASMGYKKGLIISNEKTSSGIGGGMCQLTNLIHWMVLHSPLEIVEHHHHDGFDLFPDHNRKVPFGTGTSIAYNYLDYRFYNPTNNTYQLLIQVTEEELYGQLRADASPEFEYEIRTEKECFTEENGIIYRSGNVYRKCIKTDTGETLWDKCIRKNHAKVMYDTTGLTINNR
ncbi:MAG: VanW family protein [Clostridia bacterium]|nr:VanW family protein [Clostridia bacterium]